METAAALHTRVLHLRDAVFLLSSMNISMTDYGWASLERWNIS